MICLDSVHVFISDKYILFPYKNVIVQDNATDLTIFVPTFADEKVIIKEVFTNFNKVRVLKYVSNFEENEDIKKGVVVYWNAILPIKVTGVGTTLIFNVVLSDNLYFCKNVTIDRTQYNNHCPLQVDYEEGMVCLKGELAGDSQELDKTSNKSNFFIHFDKETPMGIKILNTKRFLIALSNNVSRVKVCVYLNYDELTTIHKELSWESTRKQIRGGPRNDCNVFSRPSYKYIVDSLELLGINTNDIGTLHDLVNIFNPLILRYKLVPNIFVELNNLNGTEKHVRLYCKYEGVAITNAGPVPLNMPTKNPHPFTYKPLMPPSSSFYKEIGYKNAFVHAPVYNYFL
ncbi:unknown [Choristoneura occidentalis granulovirus]|uniref:ODV-EC43 n=2 Tax=Betabaculovirus chofumiferanae TaxID=3051997 RepID=Q8B584_GVCF|nr:unknown [Choristoneura fumiferana granulovirus]AAN77195.1 unknown [Choristoneura fumiferana granulovirus]ABC61174.1 unknown [Choristoneura fumiferana granulovirus]